MKSGLPMRLIKRSLANREDMDLPVLYKYRDSTNTRHREVITNCELFLAPPSTFTDKEDCNLETRPSLLTSQERADWAEKLIIQQFPELANAPQWERRARAQYYADYGPITDQNHVNEVRAYASKLLDKKFGVLCLTANPQSSHMWKEYAADFSGFCIGFKSDAFQDYSNGPITYVPELPVFKGNEDPYERFLNLIYLKHEQYRPEEEYRVNRIWGEEATNDQRKVIVAQEQVAEVIIGYNAAPDFADFVRQHLPGVPIRIARPDNNGGVTID